ncbi:MAG: HD domain-containing protein [Desulfuromonadales bacterium]|nr:HD domain-containing protein [Desulfuromonadales bacterium]
MEQNSNRFLLHKIERLNSIGTALSLERDPTLLLERILLGAKELTGADGGSLYILEGDQLQFRLVHTTSLNLHRGGSSATPVSFPPIPLYRDDGTPNNQMVVTRTALQNCIVNISDAYNNREFDLAGTHAFDASTGYRSHSLLAVPMQDHEQQIIGVLQLINATHPQTGEVVPFSREDESLVASLASQAAVSLNRQDLINGLETLLQSLTRLIAKAIDDKSPHTGGHCRRVPEITMALANAVNADTGPVFKSVNFSRHELDELEMAAWLHDCGKITTPEFIIDKRTKLESTIDRMQLVELRLELLRKEGEIQRLKRDDQTADLTFEQSVPAADELETIARFLQQCNTGGEWLPEETITRIREIARILLPAHNGQAPAPLLTENEVDNLSVKKGTLTDAERQLINSHVQISQRMLASLPFPKHLKNVALIAGAHHEKINGTGYPKGLLAGELPLQARILAIADIFEALTASDRVYRQPITLSAALTTLGQMCSKKEIDADLFELFLRKQAYTRYVQKYLNREQIDSVDADAICNLFRAASELKS